MPHTSNSPDAPTGERQTWHVYDDCTLRVYRGGTIACALSLRPDEAIKMAADLIIAARRLQMR